MTQSTITFNPETRYTGKVCESHPELEGLRRRRDSACPRCAYEKRKSKYNELREEQKRLLAENKLLKAQAQQAALDAVRRDLGL